ncbi:AAA family ATPase [Escherichia coli]|nr:AAA family ATPase [Escherichia coli]
MKIEKFAVDRLFDRFDYTIELSNINQGLAIIAAPNGYGKTTILKMIDSFSKGDFFIFFRESFKEVRFYLSYGKVIQIIKKSDNSEQDIIITDGEYSNTINDPLNDNQFIHWVNIIEKYIPYLRRVGPRTWRDEREGDIVNFQDILNRYKKHPALRKRVGNKISWLESVISSLAVFTISTNRLSNGDEDKSMVHHIAKNIKEKIGGAIRDQFEEGRKKETNFPTRIMNYLAKGNYPSKESVLHSIQKLKEIEDHYSDLGLIPDTETTQQFNTHIKTTSDSGAGLLVLKTYLDDVFEKLSLLDILAKKLDIFSSSVNKLISFKKIKTSIDDGFYVRMVDGKKNTIALDSLSSGEQHLIVLIGRLVFETSNDSLVLIDEPEISFHPEWQEKFIEILNEIKKMNGFDVILATHSPILIGEDYWDNVVELADQYNPIEIIELSDNLRLED